MDAQAPLEATAPPPAPDLPGSPPPASAPGAPRAPGADGFPLPPSSGEWVWSDPGDDTDGITPPSAFQWLDEDEIDGLRQEFQRSRPFNNVTKRLAELGYDRWLLQRYYRAWGGNDVVHFNGIPVLSSQTDAARLFIGRFDGDSFDVAAAIVLKRRRRGPYGQSTHVGRTTLLIPDEISGGGVYLLKQSYSIFLPIEGLANNRQLTRTFPFAQQDPDQYRCIDVSIWLGLDFMSRHLGTPRIPIGLLRGDELRSRNHLLPAPGLLPEEIMNAISAANLSPVHYQRQAVDPRAMHGPPRVTIDTHIRGLRGARGPRRVWPYLFNEVLHAYLDSQLPVFLIIERRQRRIGVDGVVDVDERVRGSAHSLCVVGHSADSVETAESPESEAVDMRTYHRHLGFLTTTKYLRDLIVHDDDIGPFLRLPMRRVDAYSPASEHPLGKLWFETVESSALSLYVGLPPEVRVAAEHALHLAGGAVMSKKWRRRYDLVFEELVVPRRKSGDKLATMRMADMFTKAQETKELVLSCYLDHSSRLKRRALACRELDADSRKAFAETALPKYVWVVEYSTRELMRRPADEPRILGEVVLDPTQSPSEHWSILSCRFPGVHFMRAVTGDRRGEFLKGVSFSQPRVQWSHLNFLEGDLSSI